MATPETEHRPSKPLQSWMNAAATMFLWAEHAAYMALGLLLAITALIALAGVTSVLLRGIGDWSGTSTIIEIIERLLFVLMVIEIMHTRPRVAEFRHTEIRTLPGRRPDRFHPAGACHHPGIL